MKVILTDNVKTLGNVGEIVNVSTGHARNYLIPNKLAVLADSSNTKQMEDYQKMLAKKVAEAKKEAEDAAKKLSGLTITLEKKIGGSGKLFGAVTTAEVADELAKKGVEVERRVIILDNIKGLGTYDVKVKLFKGVDATFKLKIEMDAKQAEEMKAKQAAAEKKASKKGKKDDTATEANAEETESTENTEA